MRHRKLCSRVLNMYDRILVALLFVGICSVQHAWAIDLGSERVRLNGFATIGLTSSGNEALGYRRDISSEGYFDEEWVFEPDTLLGLQMDVNLTNKLDAIIQLVARDRPENSLKDSMAWAFLRYRYNHNLMIHAGRVGTDLFMLSEYRNVGFAYLWAHAPMEFYGPLALDSLNGIDATYHHHLADGILSFKLYVGASKQPSASQGGDYDFDMSPILGSTLTWESNHWTSRAVFQRSQFASSIDSLIPLIDGLSALPSSVWPDAADLAVELEARDRSMYYYSLGAAYDDTPWVVQAELGYIDSGYEAAFPDLLTAYLSVGHHFESVTVYGIAALARNTQDTLDVPAEPSGGSNPFLVALQQGTQIFSERTGIDQHSLSMGLRWDLRYDTALKLQWDRTWVDGLGGALWEQSGSVSEDQTVDTLAVNLNFLF